LWIFFLTEETLFQLFQDLGRILLGTIFVPLLRFRTKLANLVAELNLALVLHIFRLMGFLTDPVVIHVGIVLFLPRIVQISIEVEHRSPSQMNLMQMA
jgi:hypothetical protein